MTLTLWHAVGTALLMTVMTSLQGCGGGGSKPQPPAEPEKVKVDFWVEGGSPESQLFVLGPLKKAVSTSGIEAIMDLNMYSFGNAYYEANETICGKVNVTAYSWGEWPKGYDDSYRRCWDRECGKGSTRPLDPGSGCFMTGPYCQYGGSGCAVNLLQMCGKFHNSKFLDYVPFAVCVEDNYRSILASGGLSGNVANVSFIDGIVKQCVESTGVDLDAKQVLDCFVTDVFHTVMYDTARQTVDHSQTPWVMVTNKSGSPAVFTGDFTNNDFLVEVVCKAWEFNGGALDLVEACKAQRSEIVI